MNLTKQILKLLGLVTLFAILIYVFGPKPEPLEWSFDDSEDIRSDIPSVEEIEEYLQKENQKYTVKKDNEPILIWADSQGMKTEYALLYLHGFSASPEEGAPIHQEIAEKYGMNLYVPRLAEHGLLEDENMINFTAEAYLNSAADAVNIAKQLGDKVIIMSTSTGSTAGLFLSSNPASGISGLICYSPNVEVFDPKASLLAGPWGIDIARIVKGGNYHTWNAPPGAEQYWHTQYRLEALVELQRLVEGTMKPEVFEKVEIPTFVGYYYKNDREQDSVVSVQAIEQMFQDLGSDSKTIIPFPNAGKHCMPSRYFGKDLDGLREKTSLFLERNFGLVAKE